MGACKSLGSMRSLALFAALLTAQGLQQSTLQRRRSLLRAAASDKKGHLTYAQPGQSSATVEELHAQLHRVVEAYGSQWESPFVPLAKAKDPNKFSWPGGADSTRKMSAPVSWPATLRPWTTRQSTRRHVARDPA